MKLTIEKLKEESIKFCKYESNITHPNLVGVTDGKAVGTYIEHKFEKYLKNKYDITIGSSSRGIDLPDSEINTDIKVTSVKKPQSSSPFKNIEQKVYGLGYNLLIFIYEKTDINNKCYLYFKHCIFINAEKSGDYNLTKMLRLLLKNNAGKDDIIEVLNDANIPGDNQVLEKLADKIISNPPKQGYLTISNAFQWRLKYNKIINLENKEINGISTYNEYIENELRDTPTPLYFTDIICEYLKNDLKISPDIIIDSTCGTSNFLKSASNFFPNKQLNKIETDENKINTINKSIPNLSLFNEDSSTFKFNNINKENSILLLGNFQHIANTELSQINEKDLKIDTILKIIDEIENTNSTIAFLCEKTVSRDIFIELIKTKIKYNFIKQLNLNSYKNFNIDENSCLFILQFGGTPLKDKICEISDISNPSQILQRFGFISGKFYSNIDNIPLIEGKCQIEWRQGVKHDCANIMELIYENNQLKNKKNETVDIENNLLYPLLKISQLKQPIINESSRYIIITQKKIKQDTSYIENEAPKTWQYLNNNKKYFDKRKSSIYNKTPDFSIFGIGDYSFKKYKVAISGFNKVPMFSLVYNNKTMMLDDASYFLSFDDYDTAYITMLILNSQLVIKFLKNIAFIDSKRPYSKKVLKRIDIEKCLKILSLDDLKDTEKELNLKKYITQKKLQKYEKNITTSNFT